MTSQTENKILYNFVDLFCGAGGFTEGMLLSGGKENKFNLVGASDLHENAMKTYTNRFTKQLNLDYVFLTKNIRDKDFSDVFMNLIHTKGNDIEIDVVVGGPPCQGFSVFGPRKKNDPRNDLFRPYLSVVHNLRPKYFIMENVPGLSMMYGGEAVRKIYQLVEALKNPAYHISGPLNISAADYGVPQLRDRILFIGSRKDVPVLEAIPVNPSRPVSVNEAIGDLSFLRA